MAPWSPLVHPLMNRISALFLQVAVVLIGLATLGFLLWEPHLEGRNAHATTFEIYFHDPFLAYVYAGSIPYFIALYRAFKLSGDVRREGGFTQATVDALHAIKMCAVVVLGFAIGAARIVLMFGDGEDRPAGIFMSFLVASASIAAAVAAAIFARTLQKKLPPSDGRLG